MAQAARQATAGMARGDRLTFEMVKDGAFHFSSIEEK